MRATLREAVGQRLSNPKIFFFFLWRPIPAKLAPGFMLIAFHKPFAVLSRFTGDGSPNRTLAEFGFPAGVYPIGRLDADSEGLLLLSDEPDLNARLLQPSRAHPRVYWAQIEGVPSARTLEELSRGVLVQGRMTLPCRTWYAGPAARSAAARSAHSLSQNRPRPLDRPGVGGRKKPPGPAHDGGGRPCDASLVPGANRGIPSPRTGAGPMAVAQPKRARPGPGPRLTGPANPVNSRSAEPPRDSPALRAGQKAARSTGWSSAGRFGCTAFFAQNRPWLYRPP